MTTSTRALLSAVALATALVAPACGDYYSDDGAPYPDNDGDDAGDALPPDSEVPAYGPGCPAEQCTTGATLDSVADLQAAIAAIPDGSWSNHSANTTGCLQISADLPVSGDLTVVAADVAVPAWCVGTERCRQQILFDVNLAPASVDGLDLDTSSEHRFHNAVRIHGPTTIRLRATRVGVGIGSSYAIVEIVKGCGATCDAEEFTCGATHTCWNSARDLCAYCLGGTNEQCACFDGTHAEPDGTQCSLALSSDLQGQGTCQAGACDTQP